jgi:hypothetical protein
MTDGKDHRRTHIKGLVKVMKVESTDKHEWPKSINKMSKEASDSLYTFQHHDHGKNMKASE